MTRTRIQSSLRDCRDELFIDTATESRLDVVTGNLGLNRPLRSFTDDEWRYIAKVIALQPKQIRNIFYRVAEASLGPQKTRIGNFDIAPLEGESIIQLDDASNILQTGELVIDPGLATEQIVGFGFRDLETNKIFLSSELDDNHSIVDTASGILVSDHTAGASTLDLVNTDAFPVTGYPYAIIADRGSATEELLVVTDNDTGAAQLTLENPTELDHLGPKATFLRKPLVAAAQAGRTFITLDTNDTISFNKTGFIRLAFGTGDEEVVEFYDNIVDDNALLLKTPLVNAHAATTSVELLKAGASVETCSIVQRAVDWSIHETRKNKVVIRVPDTLITADLRNASYLHDEVLPAALDNLADPLSTPDTVLVLNDTSAFPEAGIVEISSTFLFYIDKDDDTGTLYLTQAAGIAALAGAAVSLVRIIYTSTSLEDGNMRALSGELQTNHFYGPYIFDASQRAPSIISSLLDETVPFPTRVAIDQSIGYTTLEVEDAADYPQAPFSPYSLRIGEGSGDSEITTVTDLSLKNSTTTDVNTGALIGDFTILGDDTGDFPQDNGSDPVGYHIWIDKGGPNEELCFVVGLTSGTPGTFDLEDALVSNHSIGEAITLAYDVFTVDPLVENHTGPTYGPSAYGHLVEKLIETIDVSAGEGADFPESGTVYLNFGKERINARQKLVSHTTTELTMQDSSVFPTYGYPYKITVGQGLPTQEITYVTDNDTVTDILTVDPPIVGTFEASDYIVFAAGVPTTLEYTSKTGDTLELAEPTALTSGYTQGERVMLSPEFSVPEEEESSYAFKMPASAFDKISVLFDLIRAAGVEVVFTSDK